MNETQIDSLLEEARGQTVPEIDRQRTEAICTSLRTAIRHQHRIKRTMLASGAVLAVVLWGVMLHRPKEAAMREDAEVALERLEAARQIFPECGVALVNGEIVLCERQKAEGVGMQCLQIRLEDGRSQEVASVEVIVSEDDYVVFDDGQVTGEVLVSRCGDDGNSVVDCDLLLRRPDGTRRRIREAVVLKAGEKAGTGKPPETIVHDGDGWWLLSMGAIHRS